MGQPTQLLLASLELAAAVEPLALSRVLLVPTAANGLADREEIVHAYRSQFRNAGVEVIDWDIDRVTPPAEVPAVDAICCSGGNPYHLMIALQRSGFDRVLRHLVVHRGVRYIGASAGALVAGPSLDPIEHVTPFERPANFNGSALGLTERLVLPHDDHPGRRTAHAAAQTMHGSRRRLMAIADAETISVRGDRWQLTDHANGVTVRPATADDADGIAKCFRAAGQAAWDFVDTDRFVAMKPPVEAWSERVGRVSDPDDLLVVEDAAGLAGFIWIRLAVDPLLNDGVGEVAAFYTHPRVWGRGSGRLLLRLGLDRLRALDCHTAILYTEERNQRPRRIYEQLGWRLDGGSRDREFLGAPIRELRYRLAL